MNTQNVAQAQNEVPLMAPENYTDDAERLRAFACDPDKGGFERWAMCNIITRQKVLGTITQEQVDTLTVMQLADVIEMGAK